MAGRAYDIGMAEFQVLKVLWDHGPLTVRDVLSHLHRSGRRVAYTTVQTLLTRLEQKGYVASDKSELAFVFRATLSRNRLQRSKVKSLVSQMYDGVAAPLVLQLIKTERFSPEEIQQLAKLIEEMDSSADKPKS